MLRKRNARSASQGSDEESEDAQAGHVPSSGGEDPVSVAESNDDRANEADVGGVGLAPRAVRQRGARVSLGLESLPPPQIGDALSTKLARSL